MAGRRISARGLSMSRAAKQHLKNKKRKKKIGVSEKEPEVSSKGFWILVIAVLIVLGFVVTHIASGRR